MTYLFTDNNQIIASTINDIIYFVNEIFVRIKRAISKEL